jgi:hypothetical protein
MATVASQYAFEAKEMVMASPLRVTMGFWVNSKTGWRLTLNSSRSEARTDAAEIASKTATVRSVFISFTWCGPAAMIPMFPSRR